MLKCAAMGSPRRFIRKSSRGMAYRAQDPSKTPAWMHSQALEIVDDAVRGPERQRRQRDRRIGGPHGREGAASNQIKVRVIMRALERIDNRLLRLLTIAHPISAHDVTGAAISQARLFRFALDRLRRSLRDRRQPSW